MEDQLQLWVIESAFDDDGDDEGDQLIFYSYQEAIDFCNDEGIEISEIKEVLI